MYIAVRRGKTTSGAAEEVAHRVRSGFLPIISQAPGLLGYYVATIADDEVLTVSVFKDRAGAEESNQLAAGWVRENLAALIPQPLDVLAGEVLVHTEAQAVGA